MLSLVSYRKRWSPSWEPSRKSRMQTPSQQSPSQVRPNARQQAITTLSHSQKPRRRLQPQVLTNGRQTETPRREAPSVPYHGRRDIAPRHARLILDIYMNRPCKEGVVSSALNRLEGTNRIHPSSLLPCRESRCRKCRRREACLSSCG